MALPFALLGLAASYFAGKESSKRLARQSRELAELQNRLNVEQWERENLYNTPVSQMQRLREAGLAPQLFAPSGNVSASSPSLTTGDPEDYRNVAPQSISAALQIASISKNLELTDAQITKTKADARMANAQADAFTKERDQTFWDPATSTISKASGTYYDMKAIAQKMRISEQFQKVLQAEHQTFIKGIQRDTAVEGLKGQRLTNEYKTNLLDKLHEEIVNLRYGVSSNTWLGVLVKNSVRAAAGEENAVGKVYESIKSWIENLSISP